VREVIGRVLAALGAIVFIALVWFFLQVDPIFSSPGKEVVVVVHSGESFSQVAADLGRRGVIASPLAFRLEALVLGVEQVQVGDYQLRQGSSFSTVRAVLGTTPNVHPLDNAPGTTTYDLYQQVAQDEGASFATALRADLAADVAASPYHHGASPEGLIGQRTYLLTPATTPAGLARRMVEAFAAEAASVGLTPSTTRDGLDAYQLIVAASIVEKEGYYPKNMPKVARVIFNRLAAHDALQMDATVLYALHVSGGTVTHAMEQTPSPYNTYLNPGLTPTPICTVPAVALSAVLHAPPGTWMYFVVVDQSGDEAFSTTFARQLQMERLAASRGLG
jgi:peptidoglycan lytic transglycosylase G